MSGLNDMDYPSANGLLSGLSNVKHVTTTNKVPLPPEVMEHFGRILFLKSDKFFLSSSILMHPHNNKMSVSYNSQINQIVCAAVDCPVVTNFLLMLVILVVSFCVLLNGYQHSKEYTASIIRAEVRSVEIDGS